MSLNYQKDPAAQVPTLTTGSDGVDSIINFYQDGTSEIKNLLKNECSIIYECSYCRSLFRSIVNFVAHKRTICRSLQSSVRLELKRTVASKIAGVDNEKSASSRSRRNPTSLRRLNIASLLGKHIQNFSVDLEAANETIEVQTLPKISRPTASTTFQNGKQTVEALPTNLNIKDRIPEDRTVLVMPQDNSIRYREMQLRTRRNANDAKSVNCRELSQQDIEILQRIPPTLLNLADLQELRCNHESCTNIQPFASVAIISHHLAISHQKSVLPSTDKLPFGCFICGTHFETQHMLQDHFNEVHTSERAAHINQRLALSNKSDNITSRRGVSQKKRSSSPEEDFHCRSISPSDISSRTSVTFEDSGENSRQESVDDKAKAESNRSRRLAERRRPHSAAISRKNSPRQRDVSTTHSKTDLIRNSNSGKRIKLINSNEKLADQDSSNSKAVDILINGDEARRLDELLNTASSVKMGSLEKEESEDEDGQPDEKLVEITADVEKNVVAPVGRVQRNKKPTKRFYNDDFVVDPTKLKEVIKTPNVDALKKTCSIESGDIQPFIPKTETEIASTAAPSTATTKRRNRTSKARVRSLGKVTKSKTTQNQKNPVSEQSDQNPQKFNNDDENERNPSEEKKLAYPDDNYLESRKEVIDKALRAELDTGESVISIRSSPLTSYTKKSTSEPPRETDLREQNGNLRRRSGSAEFEFDSDRYKEHSKEEANNSDEIPPKLKRYNEIDSSAKSILTNQFVRPSSPSPSSSFSSVRNQLPSILVDKNRELMSFYTPRALRARIAEEERIQEVSATVGSSRRKQNLKEVGSTLDKKGIDSPAKKLEKKKSSCKIVDVLPCPFMSQKDIVPPRPSDLAEIPVYLTEVQRDMFFSPLRPLFNSASASDGLHQCSECGEVLRCQRDGRRHMVGHLRVMRIRCMLCDVGAFFCGDMRIHLMFRHCEKLNLAPEGFVAPGDAVPCMDKQKADMLTQLVDPLHPGRVFFTSGKIISWTNPKAYFPDPRIEERILGKARPKRSTSITPSPVKSKISATSSPFPSIASNSYDKLQQSFSSQSTSFNLMGSKTASPFGNKITKINPINYISPVTYGATSSSNIGSTFHHEPSPPAHIQTTFSTQPNILSSSHKIVLMKPVAESQKNELSTRSCEQVDEKQNLPSSSVESTVSSSAEEVRNATADSAINEHDHGYCAVKRNSVLTVNKDRNKNAETKYTQEFSSLDLDKSTDDNGINMA